MKKSRIILGSIFVMAAVGGAVASQVRATDGAIWNGSQYVAVQTQAACRGASAPCIYTLPDESTTRFYTHNGTTFVPAFLEP